MTKEVAILTKDNTVDRQLVEDGAVVDLTPVTRITLTLDDGTVIDSNTSPSAIDWSQGNGIVVFSLGAEEISFGTYKATITVYDSAHPNGIVWDTFDLQVI